MEEEEEAIPPEQSCWVATAESCSVEEAGSWMKSGEDPVGSCFEEVAVVREEEEDLCKFMIFFCAVGCAMEVCITGDIVFCGGVLSSNQSR